MEGLEWSPIHNSLMEVLEKPFSEEEVRKTVFECDGNKAPGPDGFTMLVC